MSTIERLGRIARRVITSGQISSSPIPIIRRYFNSKPAFFVQVGSNEGREGDPLHDLIAENPLWRGLFIEPVHYVFEKLVRNYGRNGRFTFEQIAISDQSGERDFSLFLKKAPRTRQVHH